MEKVLHNVFLYMNNLNCIPGSFQGETFEDCELEFCVQESEVISSLDLVVPLMNLGEKCEILVDPEFAYGKKWGNIL